MSLVTFALLVSIVAVVASVVYSVTKAIGLFRDTRAFFRGLGGAAEEFGVSVERLAAHEPPELERLGLSASRLRASQARLSIELGALRRVREQWGALLAVYPRK